MVRISVLRPNRCVDDNDNLLMPFDPSGGFGVNVEGFPWALEAVLTSESFAKRQDLTMHCDRVTVWTVTRVIWPPGRQFRVALRQGAHSPGGRCIQ